ncbi:MAG: hypothetical protein HYX92_11240 [Chloroflexi bacterium]|nr:hypothetical protein [Chloroflexota bacterium]
MSASKLASSRAKVVDSVEAVYELVCEAGWGDGLPVVPPTEDRVREMLASTTRDQAEIVAEVEPGLGKATVEKIAINAVMAGCLPAYLPVVIAAVEAITEPQFNLNGVQCTTNPVAPLAIINGPVVKKLDVNYDYNCLGQGRRSNATIGRAIRFVLLNIGGGIPGTVDKATVGQPAKYSFCLAENEDRNPWQPLHVERGFARDDSTVTVVAATATINVLTAPMRLTGPELLTLVARTMNGLGSNNFINGGGGEVLVILPPRAAGIVDRDGFSKDDVKRFLFEESKVSLSYFPEPMADWISEDGRVIDGMVPLVPTADDIMIVVAGGVGGGHAMFLPTFGETRAVTKLVRE